MYITLHMHSGWTMVSSPVIVQPCTFPVGPRVPTSRDPLEMFSHFMDDTFLSNIVRETNRYAAQHTAPHMHSTWETDLEELKAYLGFMIVMGLNHLPEIRDYWSTDRMLHNAFIATRISRDRFEEISRNLHFVDNRDLPLRDEPGYHRLQKVLPLIDAMKTKFQDNYHPHMQNSIDEAMIPFKGIYTCSSMKECVYAHILTVIYTHTHWFSPPNLSTRAQHTQDIHTRTRVCIYCRQQ